MSRRTARCLRWAGLLLLATAGAFVYLASVAPPALADNCGTLADCFAVGSAMANAASAAALIAPIAMAAGAGAAGAGTAAGSSTPAAAPSGQPEPTPSPAAAEGANAAAQARVASALGQAPIAATPAPAPAAAGVAPPPAPVAAPQPAPPPGTPVARATRSRGSRAAPSARGRRRATPTTRAASAPRAATPAALGLRAVRALEDVLPPEQASDPRVIASWRPGWRTRVQVAVELPATGESGPTTPVRRAAEVRVDEPGLHGEDVSLRAGDLSWAVEEARQVGTPDRPAIVRVLVNRSPCTRCSPLLATHLNVITSQLTPVEQASIRFEVLSTGAYERNEEIPEDERHLYTARRHRFADLTTTSSSIERLLESGWDVRALTRNGVLSLRGQYWAGAVDHMRSYMGLPPATPAVTPLPPAPTTSPAPAPPPAAPSQAPEPGPSVAPTPPPAPPSAEMPAPGPPLAEGAASAALRGEPYVPPVDDVAAVLRGEPAVPDAAFRGERSVPNAIAEHEVPSPHAARAAVEAARALRRRLADLAADPSTTVPAPGVAHPILQAAYDASSLAFEAATGAHQAYDAAYRAAQVAPAEAGPHAEATHRLSQRTQVEYQAALATTQSAQQGGPPAAQHAARAAAHAEQAAGLLVQAADAATRAIVAAAESIVTPPAPAGAPAVGSEEDVEALFQAFGHPTPSPAVDPDAAPLEAPAAFSSTTAPDSRERPTPSPGTGIPAGPTAAAEVAAAAAPPGAGAGAGATGPPELPPPGPPKGAAASPAGEPDPGREIQDAARVVDQAHALLGSVEEQSSGLARTASSASRYGPRATTERAGTVAAAAVEAAYQAAQMAVDAANAASRAADATSRLYTGFGNTPIPIVDSVDAAVYAREQAQASLRAYDATQEVVRRGPAHPDDWAWVDEVAGYGLQATDSAARTVGAASEGLRAAARGMAETGRAGDVWPDATVPRWLRPPGRSSADPNAGVRPAVSPTGPTGPTGQTAEFPVLAGDLVFVEGDHASTAEIKWVWQAIRALVEGRTYGDGFTVHVRRIVLGRNETTFEVDVLHLGRKVGDGIRVLRWSGSTLSAHHDRLKIDDETLRGRGFATDFLRRLEAWYRASGVDHVQLRTAWDGHYVWARRGFRWSREDDARTTLGRLERLLDEPDVTPSERAAARELLDRAARSSWGDVDFPTVAEVADLGRLEPRPAGAHEHHLGRRVLNKEWHGQKDLR